MMMHGHQPVPYPAGQMAGQFVQHPQMYGSPQQPQAYMNGPPPPTSQGFPSPGRPAPTMMMHQGSSQGTPGGAQMLSYGLQPGQGGPMYGAQGQQPPQMGMIRGQPPPPPHQAGPLPPPYYHGHQSHYPGNRGNYGGPSNGPPPQQQQQQMAPPLQQQQQPPQQQQPVEAGEDGK